MFGNRRTNWEKGKQFQGVETPSQSRFVGYYDIITNKLGGLLPSIKTINLKKITINSIKGNILWRFAFLNNLIKFNFFQH
jgi:PTEN homologous phosphatase